MNCVMCKEKEINTEEVICDGCNDVRLHLPKVVCKWKQIIQFMIGLKKSMGQFQTTLKKHIKRKKINDAKN